MKRIIFIAALALAGCEHISGDEVAIVVGEVLGGAGGALTATAVAPSPQAVPVAPVDGGGVQVVWEDAGGPCSQLGDRVCCTPAWIDAHTRPRDGG